MWAKNPSTNNIEEVATWDVLGREYSVTFADGTRALIGPGEEIAPPEFEIGDLVNRMIDETHPDFKRMEGRVNRFFYENGWTFEIFWNIWSLEDPSANRIESWTADHLEISSDKYTVPRFLVGERADIQALGVVTRNHKIIGYSHWETPPAGDFDKKDKGWWVEIQFDAGPGAAAERQMWNEANPPLHPEDIRDDPEGITTYLGNDRDTIFVISNEARDRQGTPIQAGKLSEGLQLDKLTIDNYKQGTAWPTGLRYRGRGIPEPSWQTDSNPLFSEVELGEEVSLLGQEAGPMLELSEVGVGVGTASGGFWKGEHS